MKAGIRDWSEWHQLSRANCHDDDDDDDGDGDKYVDNVTTSRVHKKSLCN